MKALDIYNEITRKEVAFNWILFIGILSVIWLFNPVTALPTPLELYRTTVYLATVNTQENLFYNTFVTLKLQAWGLVLSVILSLIITYAGRLPLIAPLSNFVQFLRYIPIHGFMVFLYAFFAIGFGMKVAMLTIGLSFFMVTSMNAVLDDIPRLKYELAKSLDYSNWQIFTSVVFFPTLPYIIRAVKQNAAMGWLMIVAVESFARTEGGLGSELKIYSESSKIAESYVIIFVIGVIAIIENLLFTKTGSWVWPWMNIKVKA